MHEPTELSGASAAGKPKFEGFVLSVEAKDNVDAVRKFNAQSQGGQCGCHLPRHFRETLRHGRRPPRRWVDDHCKPKGNQESGFRHLARVRRAARP
jgi:hypothetical protein